VNGDELKRDTKKHEAREAASATAAARGAAAGGPRGAGAGSEGRTQWRFRGAGRARAAGPAAVRPAARRTSQIHMAWPVSSQRVLRVMEPLQVLDTVPHLTIDSLDRRMWSVHACAFAGGGRGELPLHSRIIVS
jgi:hypothetical protein